MGMKYVISSCRTNVAEAVKTVCSSTKLPQMLDKVQLLLAAGFSGGSHFSAPQPESGNDHNVRTCTKPTKNQEFPSDKNTPNEHHGYDPPNCFRSDYSSHTDANKSVIFNYSDTILTNGEIIEWGF